MKFRFAAAATIMVSAGQTYWPVILTRTPTADAWQTHVRASLPSTMGLTFPMQRFHRNDHYCLCLIGCFVLVLLGAHRGLAQDRPNVLIMISDDVSWPHASAYGSKMVNSPAFDRVARQGVLFNNAFCCSPGCSPSRAALLTGRHTWMIEHAGTHASYFGSQYETFQQRLAQAGYTVAHTGKGWGPGNWKKMRDTDPCGPSIGAKANDNQSQYVAAFEKFLKQRASQSGPHKTAAPFCFWFGGNDAHRPYQPGSGLKSGKQLEQAEVPAFLPDTPEVRSDLLDYAFEVERFDHDCQQMIEMLDKAGELDNTLVIVTSDNGMPFPRAKANCYEYGIHMPLAICWNKQVPAGRVVDDLVSFVDLTATIYEATGVSPPTTNPIVGNSLVSLLRSDQSGLVEPSRTAVFAARERHSSSRYNSLGYPQRAIRTQQYLYIENLAPQRWPAGPGQRYDRVQYQADGSVAESKLSKPHAGYHDIDGCPTLNFLTSHADDPQYSKYLKLAVGLRPAQELYDIVRDPMCINNLAASPEAAQPLKQCQQALRECQNETGDLRIGDQGDIWETYPRVSSLRWFPKPEWAKAHPELVPKQDWVEEKRPR